MIFGVGDYAVRNTVDSARIPKDVKAELDGLAPQGVTTEGMLGDFFANVLANHPSLPQHFPKTYAWFNTAWMPKKPDMAQKLLDFQSAIHDYDSQTKEQKVRAFWDHRDPVMPSAVWWKRLVPSYHDWVDGLHFLITQRQKCGIDVDVLDPALLPHERRMRILNDPYLRATIYKNSASKKLVEMALNGTTHLLGTELITS